MENVFRQEEVLLLVKSNGGCSGCWFYNNPDFDNSDITVDEDPCQLCDYDEVFVRKNRIVLIR